MMKVAVLAALAGSAAAFAPAQHGASTTAMSATEAQKDFFGLIMHFFNHQTHHRGQVTTLLWQAGVDPGDTDLVILIPSEPVA